MTDFLADVNPALVVLVSAFLPLLQAVINRYSWATEVKALVSFATAILVGVGVAWLQDTFTREGILLTCAAVYTMSQVAFAGVWRPTGTANEIEKRTS
ncbi:MAG: hypothetical protein ACSLE9_07920 [Burkholderiaceae bacterium]